MDTDFDPLLKSATELEAYSQKRQKEIQDEIKQIDVDIVSSSSVHRQLTQACCRTYTRNLR